MGIDGKSDGDVKGDERQMARVIRGEEKGAAEGIEEGARRREHFLSDEVFAQDAFATFVAAESPAWAPVTEIVRFLTRPMSLGRVVFELGRRWERRQMVARCVEAGLHDAIGKRLAVDEAAE